MKRCNKPLKKRGYSPVSSIMKVKCVLKKKQDALLAVERRK